MSNVIDNSIFEAFTDLDRLNEDTFKVDDDGIKELSEFDKMDDIDDSIEIIDDNAENEEDLDDSYLGKIVLACNICGSKVFEDRENVEIDDNDKSLANTEVECPYCHTIDGFKILGQIGEFCTECDEVKVTVDADNKDDVDVTVTDDEPNTVNESLKEVFDINANIDASDIGRDSAISVLGGTSKKNDKTDVDENIITNAIKHSPVGAVADMLQEQDDDEVEYDDAHDAKELARKKWEKKKAHKDMQKSKHHRYDDELEESFDGIEIRHNGEKINVSTEPDETVENAPTEEVIEPVDNDTRIDIEDGDDVDVGVDSVDEKSLDNLGESYLRQVYGNVKSYKTTKIKATPNKLITEGIITFTSGAKKKTNFEFTPYTITKTGKTQFLGENLQITKNKKAFRLTGTVKNNKFLGESLTYNYSVTGANGKSTRCNGTVKYK